MFNSLLYFNSSRGQSRLKHLTPLIWVKIKDHQAILKIGYSRFLRFLHPWVADHITRSYTSFQKTKMNLSQLLLLLLLLSLYYFKSTPKPRMYPPKNREIALWPNTRVVKYKFCISQKRIEANHKSLWYDPQVFLYRTKLQDRLDTPKPTYRNRQQEHGKI